MKNLLYPIPDGISHIDIKCMPEDNVLVMTFVPKSPLETLCDKTGMVETGAVVGDVAIVWNKGMMDKAVISVIEDWERKLDRVVFVANNGVEYDKAIKFRDLKQYLDIIGNENIREKGTDH